MPNTGLITIFYILFLMIFFKSALADTASFDKELSQYAYPFKVHDYELSHQQHTLTMRYMDVGLSSSEKVMVLLHGKNFSGFYWQQIAQDLVNRGWRVIIPDQIGFGKSSKPQHYQYSFSQLANNTQQLLQSLNIKNYSLVGHSMGGMLGVTMAYLFENQVSKLILINPIGLEPYLDYVQFKDTHFFYEREQNKTVEKVRQYQKKNYYAGKWHEDYEKLLTPIKGWLNGPHWNAVAWSNALTYGPIFIEDITAKFDRIVTPTHLIIGTRDTTGPGRGWKKPGVTHTLGQYKKLALKAQSSIPNATLHTLPGLGHMPQIENYQQFSEVFYSIIN